MRALWPRILLSGICILALTGCTEKKVTPPRAPVQVRTLTASPVDVPHWQNVMGKTEGTSQVEIRSQVSGVLQKLAYREGMPVQKGQLLFVIDPAPFQAALQQASASKDQAAAALEQANRELKRTKALAEKQAAPQKELDDAITAQKSAKATLLAAEARVQNARIDLAHTKILAPSDGVAELSLINPGALVSAQSTLLTTLTQKADLRVVFAVSDRDLARANLDKTNLVEVRTSDGQVLPAQLDYVSQGVTSTQGTRQFRAKLLQTNGILSGEFVRVRLQTGVEKGVFLIPQSAVIQESDGTYSVFTLDNGKAKKHAVTVGAWNQTDWIIRTGLKSGDKVIIDQILRIRDGHTVTERKASAS